VEYNNAIPFHPQANLNRRVREFYSKNPIIRSFLAGLEKKDEKFLINDTKVQQFSAGDRAIRKSTRDRCLFIVVHGEFFTMDDEQVSYKAGAILGTQQFLHNDAWGMDLICRHDDSVLGRIDYDSFLQLKETQTATAMRLHNRILRHMAFELIYEKKNNIEYYHEHLER